MTEIQDEVVELEDEVAFMFDEVAALDDEQNIQDERILTVEQETSGRSPVSIYVFKYSRFHKLDNTLCYYD